MTDDETMRGWSPRLENMALAAHHDGPAKGRAPERDPRLLRGRAPPRLDGDERLGGAAEPAWWLNLQAQPEAWSSWPAGQARGAQQAAQRAGSVNSCGSAGARSTRTWTTGQHGAPRETAVVVLEPAAAE
jgi:hypothetical protein